jgi:hypothetical protein
MVFYVGLGRICTFASDVFTLLDLFASTSQSNVYAEFAKTLKFCLLEGSRKFLNKIHKYFAVLFTNYEIRGACAAYGGDGMCVKWILWVNLMERDHLEDLGVDGRIILK